MDDPVSMKLKELDTLLAQRLGELGFKRQKKFWYTRKNGEYLQHAWLYEVKVRGKNQYSLEFFHGFTIEDLTKVMDYLRGYKYDKYSVSFSSNMYNIVFRKEHREFNIYLTEATRLEDVVEDVISVLERLVEPFWEENDTLEKFACHWGDREYQKIYGYMDDEWYHLSYALLKDPSSWREVVKKYQERFDRPANRRFGDFESRILRYIENGGVPDEL